ncbi:hypothetical protein [Martelella soudanensis]|uniref:hypothetical protein n=1 Tax=unclassified Martelella TaxID=2629616 RepID=UPI0015DD7E63|nr:MULTISPECIES: hypothetical protein [unclassified Martelella]
MEDDSVGDPRLIRPDDTGILRHADGRAVAYAAHGPRTRGGVDAIGEREKASAPAPTPDQNPQNPQQETTKGEDTGSPKKDMKPDDDDSVDGQKKTAEMKPAAQKGGYKTR